MTRQEADRDLDRAAVCRVMLRQMDPLHAAKMSDLLSGEGPVDSNPLLQEIEGVPQPTAWTAGLFVENELAGVVRVSDASGEGDAEATLFVDHRWRRKGVGSMLLKATLEWARRAELGTLKFICDRADWPMRNFGNKFGARLDLVLGKIVLNFPLRSPP